MNLSSLCVFAFLINCIFFIHHYERKLAITDLVVERLYVEFDSRVVLDLLHYFLLIGCLLHHLDTPISPVRLSVVLHGSHSLSQLSDLLLKVMYILCLIKQTMNCRLYNWLEAGDTQSLKSLWQDRSGKPKTLAPKSLLSFSYSSDNGFFGFSQ